MNSKKVREGFLRGNTSILSEFRKRVSEKEEESNLALSVEISRQTYLIGTRLESVDDVGRQIRISSSLSLLTQAQLLTSTDSKEARKLFNLAKRLGK